MKHFLSVLFLLFAFGASAQEAAISKTKFHWGRQQDTAAGYTQAILSDNVLYISGTVGRGQTMAEQLKSIYEGIGRTLKYYGASFQHVVKENLYTTDIEATKAANDVRKPFYRDDFRQQPGCRLAGCICPQRLLRWKS